MGILCFGTVDTLQNINMLPREQIKFMKHVEKSTQHRSDHQHEISLPLCDPNLHLPVHKSQSLQRANHLKLKFLNNPRVFKDYKVLMNDLMTKNHAEK